MKTYIDAELQVVRLNNNDIVTLSGEIDNTNESDIQLSAGRGRFEDWDAGY